MVRCVICGILSPGKNVSFHSFPLKNKELCKKWAEVVPRKNFLLNHNTKVCSRHFAEDDYMKGYITKKKLVDGAVPSLNLSNILNEVENTPVNIPVDHAYCRGKSTEKFVENTISESLPKKAAEKPIEKPIVKLKEKPVQNLLGKSIVFSNENTIPILKEKLPNTNQGILIDTSQYQVIELPDNFKMDDLLTNSTVIHYKNIHYQNSPNNNNSSNNSKLIKVNSKPPSAVQPAKLNTPWHSDHIYNKSLEMIEKQESILQRKERSIKKLRLKLINSQKKSRRQALKIKELKSKIMELMVQNAAKNSCSECVEKHFMS